MSATRKPYRVTARATTWSNADGTTDPIVKLFGGTRGSIAIDYSHIPHLIRQLEHLHTEHDRITAHIDNLFTKEPRAPHPNHPRAEDTRT